MEVGSSESQYQLGSDANWWLEDSNGDIQPVITMSVNDGKEIVIVIEDGKLPGHLEQTVIEESDKSPRKVKMSRHPNRFKEIPGHVPLDEPFEKVMLRLASQSQEGDSIFPVEAEGACDKSVGKQASLYIRSWIWPGRKLNIELSLKNFLFIKY